MIFILYFLLTKPSRTPKMSITKNNKFRKYFLNSVIGVGGDAINLYGEIFCETVCLSMCIKRQAGWAPQPSHTDALSWIQTRKLC